MQKTPTHDACRRTGSNCNSVFIQRLQPCDILVDRDGRIGIYLGDRTVVPSLPPGRDVKENPHLVATLNHDLSVDAYNCGSLRAAWRGTGHRDALILSRILAAIGASRNSAPVTPALQRAFDNVGTLVAETTF